MQLADQRSAVWEIIPNRRPGEKKQSRQAAKQGKAEAQEEKRSELVTTLHTRPGHFTARGPDVAPMLVPIGPQTVFNTPHNFTHKT